MPDPQRALWDDLAGLVNGDVLSPTGEAMGSEGWSPPPGLLSVDTTRVENNPQALPYVPFDRSAQTGSDYIASLLPRAAALALPEGYTAVPTSGYRPGAVAGDTGLPSEHASANAFDWQIRDARGDAIPGSLGRPDVTGHYRDMALAMRSIADPAMQPWLQWGGNFGRVDPIHMDAGGPRGVRGVWPVWSPPQQVAGR
jgi:hypothetical protein